MKTIMLRELRRLRTPVLVVLGIVGLYALAALLLSGSVSPRVRIGGAVAWLVALPLLALALGARLMAPSEDQCPRSWLAKAIVGAGLLAGLYGLLIGAVAWTDPLLVRLHGDVALLLPGVVPPIVTHFALSVLLLCAAMAISSVSRTRIVAAAVAPVAVAAVLGLYATATEWVFGPLWGPFIGVHWRTAHLALDQLTVLALVLGAIFLVAFARADRGQRMRTGFLWLVGLSIGSMPPLALAAWLLGAPLEESGGLPWLNEAHDGSALVVGMRLLPYEEQAAWIATVNDDGSDSRVVARGPINALRTNGPGLVFVWGCKPLRGTGLRGGPEYPYRGPLWFCSANGRIRRLPVSAREVYDEQSCLASPSGELLCISPRVLRLGERIEALDLRVGSPVQVSADERRLFWRGPGQQLAVTELDTGRSWMVPPPADAPGASYDVSPDGRWVAWREITGPPGDWSVRRTIIEEVGGDRRAEFAGRSVARGAWSPDGQYCLLEDSSSSRPNEGTAFLELLELPSLRIVRTIRADAVRSDLSRLRLFEHAWSPDGRWFAFLGRELISTHTEVLSSGEVREHPTFASSGWVWQVAVAEPVLLSAEDPLYECVWSGNDRLIAGGMEGIVAIDVPSGRQTSVVQWSMPNGSALNDLLNEWRRYRRR